MAVSLRAFNGGSVHGANNVLLQVINSYVNPTYISMFAKTLFFLSNKNRTPQSVFVDPKSILFASLLLLAG